MRGWVTVAVDGGQWSARRAVYGHTHRKRLAVSGTRDRCE